jgi:glycine/D-amino acid oxidase-like deaminating enzyme
VIATVAAHAPDFAIVGGGLVGASLALGLARQKQKVAILDEGDAGLVASCGNFGLVWVQAKGMGMPAYGRWTRWSADNWAEFAADLRTDSDIDAVYTRPGGIMPALSEAHLHRLDQDLRTINAQPGFDPYAWEVLSGRELRQRIPEIGQEVSGAIYCSQDGAANPLKLWRALHVAMHRLGVSYHPGRRVRTIEPRGTGFKLTLDGGELHAGRVILVNSLPTATPFSHPIVTPLGLMVWTYPCSA